MCLVHTPYWYRLVIFSLLLFGLSFSVSCLPPEEACGNGEELFAEGDSCVEGGGSNDGDDRSPDSDDGSSDDDDSESEDTEDENVVEPTRPEIRPQGKWSTTTLSGAPEGRHYHHLAWTEKELFVWGGTLNGGGDSVSTNTGGLYNPKTNSWRSVTTSGAPSPRGFSNVEWTGREVIVWGGGSYYTDGALYDPEVNIWRKMSDQHSLSERVVSTSVWTGSEFIVWGGITPHQETLSDGAVFDPKTNSWHSVTTNSAPTSRMDHQALWMGKEMFVWGGNTYIDGKRSKSLREGGFYDPQTNTWRKISQPAKYDFDFNVRIKDENTIIFLAAPQNLIIYFLEYKIQEDEWSEIFSHRPDVALSANYNSYWVGDRFYTIGCKGVQGATPDSYYYDLTKKSVVRLENFDEDCRHLEKSIWTGNSLIIWGGRSWVTSSKFSYGKILFPDVLLDR